MAFTRLIISSSVRVRSDRLESDQVDSSRDIDSTLGDRVTDRIGI